MHPNNRLIPTLIGVLAVGLLLTAAGVDAQPFGDRIAGTWLTVYTAPPRPYHSHSEEEFAMPQYVTLHADGTGLGQYGAPAMAPLLVDGAEVATALIGPAVGSWEKVAPKRVRFTTLSFLTNAETGEPFGFLKNHLELEQVTPEQMQGQYFVELLDMTGNPLLYQGDPMTWGGRLVQSRLPVERIPRQ